MPVTVAGVEEYVRKTYREREDLLAAIKVQIWAVLGQQAGKELLFDVERACLLSQDLGSMRRLLGDLKHKKGAKPIDIEYK